MPGKEGEEKREWEPGKRRLEDTWLWSRMMVMMMMIPRMMMVGVMMVDGGRDDDDDDDARNDDVINVLDDNKLASS